MRFDVFDIELDAITPDQLAAAVTALAHEEVPQCMLEAFNVPAISFSPDCIIKKLLEPRILFWESPAVARAAMESSVARRRAALAPLHPAERARQEGAVQRHDELCRLLCADREPESTPVEPPCLGALVERPRSPWCIILDVRGDVPAIVMTDWELTDDGVIASLKAELLGQLARQTLYYLCIVRSHHDHPVAVVGHSRGTCTAPET